MAGSKPMELKNLTVYLIHHHFLRVTETIRSPKFKSSEQYREKERESWLCYQITVWAICWRCYPMRAHGLRRATCTDWRKWRCLEHMAFLSLTTTSGMVPRAQPEPSGVYSSTQVSAPFRTWLHQQWRRNSWWNHLSLASANSLPRFRPPPSFISRICEKSTTCKNNCNVCSTIAMVAE